LPPYQRKQKEAQEPTARTANKGHGRQEYRRLTRTTALNDYRDGPDVGQVFARERVRVRRDKTEGEVVYGITSLGRDRADAGGLLGRVRGPWGIANGRHYVKDETRGEDRCRVRKGNGAQVLAALRNAVVHLREGVKASSKAAATRRFAASPEEALPLLFT
jgi:predicted transposase YbfD/YdcC